MLSLLLLDGDGRRGKHLLLRHNAHPALIGIATRLHQCYLRTKENMSMVKYYGSQYPRADSLYSCVMIVLVSVYVLARSR